MVSSRQDINKCAKANFYKKLGEQSEIPDERLKYYILADSLSEKVGLKKKIKQLQE